MISPDQPAAIEPPPGPPGRRARPRLTIFRGMYAIAVLAVMLGPLLNTVRKVNEQVAAQHRATEEWVAWSGHICQWILNNTCRPGPKGFLPARIAVPRTRFGWDESDAMVWALTTPTGREVAAAFHCQGGRLVRVTLAGAGREVEVPVRSVAAEAVVDLPALLPEAFR